MRASTVPPGLERIVSDDDDFAAVEFHVYGLAIGGEVLGLGTFSGGLEPYVCLGLPAVRAAVATRRDGWDVAGDWVTHADDAQNVHDHCALVDCDGTDDDGHFVQTIRLPQMCPVHYWRVVNTEDRTERLWVLTPDGPMPLDHCY